MTRGLILSTMVSCAAFFGCQGVEPTAVEPQGKVTPSGGNSPIAHGTGGGQYVLELLGQGFPAKFSFSAKQFADGRVSGQFRHELDLLDGIPGVIEGGVASFHGRVTCVSVDLEEGRLWIGGVVTKNLSTQPFYRDDPTTQVGTDIWFRVLDAGEGQGVVDRTTFTGFEGGAGIITSEEYCAVQPWADNNARTHPVQGNVQVHD